MTTPPTPTVTPADFGDDEAFNLGEYRAPGSVDLAVRQVQDLLVGLFRSFGIEKVQFNWNGTPAVMSVHDTPKDVLVDWNTRRDAYQRAAGIV